MPYALQTGIAYPTAVMMKRGLAYPLERALFVTLMIISKSAFDVNV
jgi:hypothetical protein